MVFLFQNDAKFKSDIWKRILDENLFRGQDWRLV